MMAPPITPNVHSRQSREPSPMKLRHLETLHAIPQTGSVTHAVKFPGVSQPSVRAVLQHCELRLDLQLFE